MAQTQSTDDAILRFATDFRRGVLGRRESRFMCRAVSLPLATLLAMSFNLEVVPTACYADDCEHTVLLLPDGRILDPTADQFTPPKGETKLPPVYLGQWPTWYEHDELVTCCECDAQDTADAMWPFNKSHVIATPEGAKAVQEATYMCLTCAGRYTP